MMLSKNWFWGTNFIILTSLPAVAQIMPATTPITLPVPGYVVTLKGDTLQGTVRIARVGGFVFEIAFREDSSGRQRFTGSGLRGFSQYRPKLFRDCFDLSTIQKDYVHYESKPNPFEPDQLVFMERMFDGHKIKLYDHITGAKLLHARGRFVDEQINLSYVVSRVGDSKTFLLRRRDYAHQRDSLFGDCAPTIQWLADDDDRKRFINFEAAILRYHSDCP